MNTPIANMIAEMHSKGIPVEFIVSAVATLEEAMAARAVSTVSPVDTSTIDKRRAWDRERKRRLRASANSTGHSTVFHRNPPDATSILTISSKENAFNKEDKEKKESKRIARGTRIPPDFSIDDEDRKFAADLGIPPDAVDAETPQFIDYWSSVSGAKGVKLNWKATWRNRMRDIVKYRPTAKGRPSNVKPLTEFQRQQQETKDILNDLGNFARGGSGSNTENLELLPDHSGRRPESVRGGAGEAVIDLPRSGYRSSG